MSPLFRKEPAKAAPATEIPSAAFLHPRGDRDRMGPKTVVGPLIRALSKKNSGRRTAGIEPSRDQNHLHPAGIHRSELNSGGGSSQGTMSHEKTPVVRNRGGSAMSHLRIDTGRKMHHPQWTRPHRQALPACGDPSAPHQPGIGGTRACLQKPTKTRLSQY